MGARADAMVEGSRARLKSVSRARDGGARDVIERAREREACGRA